MIEVARPLLRQDPPPPCGRNSTDAVAGFREQPKTCGIERSGMGFDQEQALLAEQDGPHVLEDRLLATIHVDLEKNRLRQVAQDLFRVVRLVRAEKHALHGRQSIVAREAVESHVLVEHRPALGRRVVCEDPVDVRVRQAPGGQFPASRTDVDQGAGAATGGTQPIGGLPLIQTEIKAGVGRGVDGQRQTLVEPEGDPSAPPTVTEDQFF